MRIADAEAVKRLVDEEVAETDILDYKRELVLKSTTQRRNLLEDLTSMGNFGGGTIIYGVAQKPGNEGIPEAIWPLTDRSLAVRLDDLVRDGIEPPLLYQLAQIDVDGGFVLVVEVLPSTLGPYMVVAHGDRGFYTRHGSRTELMTEPEVRRAYTFALRSSAQATASWAERHLPLTIASDRPRVLISAVPMGHELRDVLGLRNLQLGALTPPPELLSKIRHGRLTGALHQLYIWADGFVNESTSPDGDAAAVRIHRDCSVGTVETVESELWVPHVLRTLNSHLLYAGWVWSVFPSRAPIQLRVELDGVDQCSLAETIGTTIQPRPVVAAGHPVSSVGVQREILPWEMARASVRHRVLHDFADHLAQAFGSPRYDDLFQRGRLYNSHGRTTGLILRGGRVVTVQVGFAPVDKAGVLWNASTNKVCGYVHDGAVIDLSGDALAVTEFAPGAGCPDDFIAEPTDRDVDCSLIEPQGPFQHSEPPNPTGRWSSTTLNEVLAPV